MAPESSHKDPVSRKLPGSMTVANLKRMCQQLFGLDAAKQRLFCRLVGEKDVWDAEPMDDDLKNIDHYVTSEESEVLMQEGDAEKEEDKEERLRLRLEAEDRESARLEAMGNVQRTGVMAAKSAAAVSSVH
eukprot:CAMPEP_0173381150 /NCGR_PEP_ID=MMETSP1356-20130122/3610_1 /TAXON_ID=77927 ORGANISM="Hemiselmis virescens, Strain PCC157" /NCGR_SAMPLE_ID=MMETSP1356 /ASSEMBLY_ACC=CAM_ASM_000847 /LENGTH=130 /DNA_ID=CAMNT_0014334903 /DNA_START=29 /DNA_END=421 /DNA_ORIENTATION=+